MALAPWCCSELRARFPGATNLILTARGESLMLTGSVSGHDFSRAVEAVQWIAGFSP
jgi:hypothetical protein